MRPETFFHDHVNKRGLGWAGLGWAGLNQSSASCLSFGDLYQYPLFPPSVPAETVPPRRQKGWRATAGLGPPVNKSNDWRSCLSAVHWWAGTTQATGTGRGDRTT